MPDLDAHIHAFQVDLTEQSSRDRINLAKEHWRAYVQGRAESELIRNKQAILLSAWRAEDRARRSSTARAVVCRDCGVRDLEHFYTSKHGRGVEMLKSMAQNNVRIVRCQAFIHDLLSLARKKR